MHRSPALIISMSVTFLISAVIYFIILSNNFGIFTYTFDDAYIHMAYCKHIVLNGVWGITPYEFSATSSSPLWTVILSAAYKLTGVNDLTILGINFLVSIFLIYVLYIFLKKFIKDEFTILIILLVIILISPFSLHVFSGMEHLLYSTFCLIFILQSSIILSKNRLRNNFSNKEKLFLLITVFFLSAVRYEGLILIGIVIFLFFVRRIFIYPILMLIVSLIPMSMYGFYSLSNGSYFFPNTIMIKSKLSNLLSTGFLFNVFHQIWDAFYLNYKVSILFLLALIFLFYFLRKEKFFTSLNLMLFIFLSMTILQIIFGSINHQRYEIHLLIIGITLVSISVYKFLKLKYSVDLDFTFLQKRKLLLIIFILFSLGIIFTGITYFNKTIIASRNIFEQQYQMAMFLKEYYEGESITANDIGAINYYAGLKCLDLVGLGSIEIAREIVNKNFSTDDVRRLAEEKNVKIAVVYKNWFDEGRFLPEEWIEIGNWKVQDKFILGGDTVTFYAVDHAEAESLKQNLINFSKKLPSRVIVSEEIK